MITDLTTSLINSPQSGHGDYRETTLAKLLELSRALVATHDPTEVLDQAVKAAVDIAPTADKGSLQLLSEDRETLRTVATSTPDELLQNTIAFRIGIGVAGHALQKNQTINVPDVLADERFVAGDKPLRFRALLVAPLVVKGRLLGTLSLSSEQVGAFSPYHETLSQLIADQVAAALENARLFTRRLQIQQELQQSQQFLQAAIDALSAKITILDKTGRIIAVNAAWCQYLKTNYCITPNYGLGTNYLEVYATVTGLSPTEANTVAQGIQRVTNGLQDDFYVEYSHYNPTQKQWDGIRVTRFSINNLVYVVVAHEDVTERKLAEESLRESEAKFRTLTNQLPIGVYRTTETGQIMYANPALAKILGYDTVEELMSISSQDSYYDPTERQAQIGHWKETGGIVRNEIKLRTRTGRQIWVRDTGQAFFDNIGNLLYLDGTLEDITERKQTEEQLRLLAAAISSTEEGVMIIDTQLDPPGPKIVFVNDGFCRLTGYSRTELIGQTFSILQGPKTAQTFNEQLKETLSQGQSFTGETINYRRDGSEYHVTWHISPVLDSSGQVTHYVSIQSDVTHLKRLETQFRQAQKMEAIGRLASGVAHDFNNLLTIIKSYTELIMLNFDQNDSTYQDLEQIKKASEKATGLTRQLLVFSRQQVVQPKMLNLNNVVTDMGKMLTRLIGEHIDLVTELDPDAGLVKADAGQIEQVIMNLVVNAVDAMPNGGKLTITTANAELDKPYNALRPATLEPGAYVVLMVSDTGVGMDEETRSRIFEPFFTTKEQGKGTGLGLSTVYAIITQAKGDIWVYTEPGKGTTFKIYLPCIDQRKVKTVAEQANNKPTSTYNGTETILLVEDELSVRELTYRILAKHGYKVLAATDGHHALNIWQELSEPIDLLLTDVIMPGGLNGRQLAEEIITSQSQTRVIYMSGYTDDTVIKQEILQANAHFIQKPFTPLSLARKVREVLDKP